MGRPGQASCPHHCICIYRGLQPFACVPRPPPPQFFVAPLAVGRDLPARQALSMETQQPVSRARSTTEAKSPLRWGTMEAVGANQRPGRVRSLLQLYPRLGTERDVSQVPGWLCHVVPCPPQPLVSGGHGDPIQHPACSVPVLAAVGAGRALCPPCTHG